MHANIESFFNLDYPRYEILFSIADASDPARAVVAHLISEYPQIRAKLILGEVDIGPNPKINNLIHSYTEACFDCLLISDSNVRVKPEYLRQVVSHLKPGVGAVTAVVAGTSGLGIGGKLEATFLNSFYARWMHIASAFGFPFIVGKSMLFRRSTAERFGGIANLARYVAEDFMAGQAIRRLGLRIVIMNEPICQHIGEYTFRSFWSRHIRWGRIRKAQSPLAFVVEPFLGALVSGGLGAAAFHSWLGVDPLVFFALHLASWYLLDLLVMREMEKNLDVSVIFFWLLREALAFPLWVHIACGSSINWRGTRLRILPGGLVVPRPSA